jgi:hypothetical protein
MKCNAMQYKYKEPNQTNKYSVRMNVDALPLVPEP